MSDPSNHDVLDEVVDEVRREFPALEVVGLPITGRIMRLAHHLERRRAALLADYGLTVADFDMLATMRRKHADEHPMNVRELQRSSMLSSGGTTKRLDRLERAGFVERRSDPDDRRGVLIALTPEGHALISEAVPMITRDESDLVASTITADATRERVADALRSLLAHVDER